MKSCGYTCDVRIYLAKRIRKCFVFVFFMWAVLSSQQNQKRACITRTLRCWLIRRGRASISLCCRATLFIFVRFLFPKKKQKTIRWIFREFTLFFFFYFRAISVSSVDSVCVTGGLISSLWLCVWPNSWRMTSWCLFSLRSSSFSHFYCKCEILCTPNVDRHGVCAKLYPFMGIWSNDRYLSCLHATRARSFTHTNTRARTSGRALSCIVSALVRWLVRFFTIFWAICRHFEREKQKNEKPETSQIKNEVDIHFNF